MPLDNVIKDYADRMRGNRISATHLRAFHHAGWRAFEADGEDGAYLSYEVPLDRHVPPYRENYRALAALIQFGPESENTAVHFGFMEPGGFNYCCYADIDELFNMELRDSLHFALLRDTGEFKTAVEQRPETASLLRLGLDKAEQCCDALLYHDWSLESHLTAQLMEMVDGAPERMGYAGTRWDGSTDFLYDDPITLRRFMITSRQDGAFELAEMLPTDEKLRQQTLENPERFIQLAGYGPGAEERIHRRPIAPDPEPRLFGSLREVATFMAAALGANQVLTPAMMAGRKPDVELEP